MPRWDLVSLSVWLFIVVFVCFAFVGVVMFVEWLA
jgi:hypothetical protein